MDFIGDDGWPAPLLKDASISESKARELYLQCVKIIREMYWKARLVHADLSEFNILYNASNDRMVIIDVSQSVEHDHPYALSFLRKDCSNVNDYFRKRYQMCVMTTRELFNFVTDSDINDGNVDEYLVNAQQIASSRTFEEVSQQEIVDEEVFKQAFIPQRLDEVIDHERDASDKSRDTFYSHVTGLNKQLTGAQNQSDNIESVEVVEKIDEALTADEEELGSESESENEENAVSKFFFIGCQSFINFLDYFNRFNII
jgi:RIO kinase 1